MQSILQYRKIGLAVQKQLLRDEEKRSATIAADLEQVNSKPKTTADAPASGSSSDFLESDSPQEDGNGDEEKGSGVEKTRTRLSERIALGRAFTGILERNPTVSEGRESRVFVVGWAGKNDPLNPKNLSPFLRVITTAIVGAIAFIVTVASSIDIAVLPQAAAEFGVSEVVESIATGIFLAGFAAGSVFAGPFSETFGRNIVYIGGMILFMIFIMASALAPNIGAQLVFRFLAGVFGSTPLTCAGGTISDLWNPLEKTYGFPTFAIGGFSGAVVGPVIGSYIGVGSIGSWRWAEWITLIIAGLILTTIVLFQMETYPPLLLKWKAQHLRRVTGDDRFKAELEITELTLWTRLKISMARPFLLIQEPIVLLMTLYLTVLYIVIFTFLNGYTYIFDETYGIGQGLTNVIFTAMFVGMVLAMFSVPFVYHKTKQGLEKNRTETGTHIDPEVRLWFAMLGAPAIPISLFWMGWTAYPSISIWSPIIASVFFGYGSILIFISAYMYIIDSYEIYAASALTFVTIVRFLVAGGMTVVGIPFYRNVGVHWTLTIMACISVLLTPVPYVLYKYGYVVRRWSKYAVSNKE